MGRLSIFLFLLLIATRAEAQFASISVEKHPTSMNVVQIDNRENSTLVFIEYTRENEGITWMNIHEKTFARVHGSNREYHLINSINLPINTESENKYMLFDKIGQKHAFVLEFEKIPDVSRFNIIENESEENAFNFYGIRTDTANVSPYRNLDDFVAPYPVKEMGRYADNGNIITYIKYKGIIITTLPQAVKQYGKYYTINLNIQNLSGRSVLFDPSKIYAKGWTQKKNEMFDMEVLSASEYDKKVANKQAWNNFWVALGEGMAAIPVEVLMLLAMLVTPMAMRMHTGLHIQQPMDNHIRLHTMVQQLMQLSNKQMPTIMHMRIANMRFAKS